MAGMRMCTASIARRQTEMVRCLNRLRRSGLVSSAEPMSSAAAKRCTTMARTTPTVGDTLGRPAEVAESSNRRGHQPACGLSRELPYPVVHLIPGIKGWVGSAINCNRARPLAES
jgi:hypothetical protein